MQLKLTADMRIIFQVFSSVSLLLKVCLSSYNDGYQLPNTSYVVGIIFSAVCILFQSFHFWKLDTTPFYRLKD